MVQEQPNQLDLVTTMSYLDVAETLEHRNLDTVSHLSKTDRDKLKEELRAKGAAIGREYSDAVLESTIDQMLNKQNRFVPPPEGLATLLANAYVNRETIGRRTAIFGGIGTAAVLAIYGIMAARTAALEGNVEENVEKAFNDRTAIVQQVRTLSSSSAVGHMPAPIKSGFSSTMQNAQTTLAETDAFFAKYAPKGQADDAVTGDNFKAVEGMVPQVTQRLAAVRSILAGAQATVDAELALISAKNSLDGTMKEVKSDGDFSQQGLREATTLYQSGVAAVEHRNLSNARDYQQRLAGVIGVERDLRGAKSTLDETMQQVKADSAIPPIFLRQAQVAYDRGTTAVEKRDIDSARANATELRSTYTAAKEYSAILAPTEELYGSVKDVAAEDIAVSAVNRVHQQIALAKKTGDVEALRAAKNELVLLDEMLQEATVTIIGGDKKEFRDWKNCPTCPAEAEAFYAMVELRGTNGRTLRWRIQDREDASPEEVYAYGERVESDVFQKIKADKMADKVIDNTEFGKKRRGYLTFQREYDGEKLRNLGQIPPTDMWLSKNGYQPRR
jgi:hypothetical protein